MRGSAKIVAGAALLAASVCPAIARPLFAAPPVFSARDYPGAPRQGRDDKPAAPYAMNYADEAVQSLDFQDGHVDLFSTHPASHSYWPGFSGGLGGDGAMLKLRWHPGQ
jgi:hypothetical protein